MAVFDRRVYADVALVFRAKSSMKIDASFYYKKYVLNKTVETERGITLCALKCDLNVFCLIRIDSPQTAVNNTN